MTDELFSVAEQVSGLADIDPDSGFFQQSDSSYFSSLTFNECLSNDPLLGRHFSAIFLNVRSAVRNLESFQDYLLTLNVDFTVIGLAETWLTSDNEHLCKLSGYRYFGKRRAVGIGGGVGFMVRSSVSFDPRNDLSVSNEHLECVFIEIPLATRQSKNHKRVLLGVIYRPPNANMMSFLDSFGSILTKLKAENKMCYLMGDFNINLMNHDAHPQTNDFVDLMYASAFYPLINKPTRITANSSTLIDNIFHNSYSNDQLAGLLYSDVSDHLPIFVLSKANTLPQDEPKTFMYRRINDQTIDCFKNKLLNYNWQELYGKADVESAYNHFIEVIQHLYDLSFPITIRVSKSKQQKPWISAGIKKSICTKNKLYKKYHRMPTLFNEIKYKSYKRCLNRLVKAARKHYYNAALEQHKNDLKRTWQVLKEIIGVPDRTDISKSFVIDNQEVNEPSQIANCFNKYFVNVGKDLAASLPSSDQSPTELIELSQSSIFFAPVVEGEVEQCFLQMKEGSAGHDGIKPSVIKKCKEYLLSPLAYIFNLSITEGTVPKSLKYAIVTPIYKTGEQNLMSNYRPISVLPVFSKILERLIFKRLYSYITEKDYFSKHQFGFRKKLSTEMALLTAVDKITQALDNREHAVGLFLDLKKAFDTVDSNILLQKLNRYGVRGNAFQWFVSYLNNRTQSVKYRESISQKLPVTVGVPQGSILGPLLFILYINDMPNLLRDSKAIIFADDTTLFTSSSDVESALYLLQQDADRLAKWFVTNKLSLNLSKTNFMLFTTNVSVRSRTLQLKISGSTIKRVQMCKFLGVLFDERLSWSYHVDHVCQKLRKSIGILKKASAVLDQSTMLTLYYTMIYPHLTYCHLVWGVVSMIHIMRITRLQKRVVRIICKQTRLAHTLPLFEETKIICVNDLYSYFLSLFVYKLSHCLFPQSFQSQIDVNLPVPTADNTPRRLNVRLPLCRTTLRQKTIHYQVPKFCNDFLFRMEIPETLSLHSYKKLMKSLFT